MSPALKKSTKAAKPAKPSKDTIYIDVEDEITAIIDKLIHSDAKVVALVLPKRATTLQSVVNLKLLKRAADGAKKNVVLITSDKSVVPLAGVAGLHVAKTLQTKPHIPDAKASEDAPITIESDTVSQAADNNEPALDPKASIGSLAGDEDTIDVDSQTNSPEATSSKKPKEKLGKNRKLTVPNFDKFRTKLLLGIALLAVLIVGWVFAAIILPKANITITTDTSQVDVSLLFDAKAEQKETDLDKSLVPAYKKELKKTTTEKVQATGKRDDGDKATGTLTLTNCIKDSDGFTVAAGTVFSASGLNFVTTEAVSLTGAIYQGSVCKSATFGQSKSVKVIAEAGGSKYNLSARSYSVPSQYTSASGSLLATGSDMAGGTSKLVTIVAQADIDSAKQQALDKLSESVVGEFKQQFSGEEAVLLNGSLENQPPTTGSDPELGKEAGEVSVTVAVTFAMYGVKREAIIQLIEKEVSKRIDTSRQAVQNTGLDAADIRVTDKPAAGSFKITLQTTSIAGPKLDADAIKQEVAGKRRAQVIDIIKTRPGVTDVSVKYSPFWVWSTPKQSSHISIVFKEANAK